MTKPHLQDPPQQQPQINTSTTTLSQEEVVEEEVETFYESLDRILSSANSSTSNSDDESAESRTRSRSRDRKFPVSARSYDAWISGESFCLSSLQQRRDRLLLALGLSSDPLLARRSKPGPAIPRSKSDSGPGNDTIVVDHNNNSKNNISSGGSGDGKDLCPIGVAVSSILSIGSVCGNAYSIDTVNRNSNDCDRGNENENDTIICNGGDDNVVVVVDDGNSNKCNGDGSVVVDSLGSGVGFGEKVDEKCVIKNLDNGKEFVVKEVREDGMWNKLKEVGTGRQLTMEEFEMCVGHSPIVQELMRRQNVEDQRNGRGDGNGGGELNGNGNGGGENGCKVKKKVSWLRSIKNVASSVTGYKERRSSDERDTSSEKGGRRSSSATDDSQDGTFNGPERVRVRQYGKSVKEVTALYKSQEIQAHNGSIWAVKFSLDGRFLASAGEDCVIHVWQVVETERKGELLMDRPDEGSLNLLFLTNGSPEPSSVSPSLDNPLERRRRGRTSISRKSVSLDHIVVPETVFGLSEKPICSFQGHSDDVLDLSWSKSQLLLSSSMDKTVRLWDLSSKTCLKIFSHSDYVTCIQFNPVDDRYFISGSLDAKVRIWSIPERQVVDWNDLHEMVTAACYTPDGQGALVGSYKGSCRLYNTSENKLQQKSLINLQNKKKKSHLKKITGFEFAPGSSSEVLITSADSRIRVVDGVDLVHKFKGFRNTNSQMSGSLTSNGKYVVCASEDSHVYVWKHEGDSRPSRSKGVTVTRSYEHFHCQDVSVAIPWPGMWGPQQDPSPVCHNGSHNPIMEDLSTANHPPTPVNDSGSCSPSGCSNSSPFRGTVSSAPNSYFFDRISATWPEEKLLLATKSRSPRPSLDFSNGVLQNRSAWGMVIVTAGLRGEIRTFQNFGLPVRI